MVIPLSEHAEKITDFMMIFAAKIPQFFYVISPSSVISFVSNIAII